MPGRRRKGFTAIELLCGLAISALLLFTVTKGMQTKLVGHASIEAQRDILSADAFLAQMYSDYHAAISCELSDADEEGNSVVSLAMVKAASDVLVVYEYNPETKMCYVNGVPQFTAAALAITLADDSLTVSLKVPGEQVLEFSTYK